MKATLGFLLISSAYNLRFHESAAVGDKGKCTNWIQTDPYKGWFVLFRLYTPLPPFHDKSWRPSEIEEIR